MGTLARVFALAGVILLGVGAFLPMSAGALEEEGCPVIRSGAFLNPDCWDGAEAKPAFQATYSGILVVVVAVIGLIPAIRKRPAGLWTYSFVSIGLVVVFWQYISALHEINPLTFTELDWGWGVWGSSVVLLVLSSIFATLYARQNA